MLIYSRLAALLLGVRKLKIVFPYSTLQEFLTLSFDWTAFLFLLLNFAALRWCAVELEVIFTQLIGS